MKIKSRIVSWLYCFMVIFIVFICNIKTTLASSSDHLLINEIYPNPTTGEIEWIELFNPSDTEIDLAGYSIEDGTNSPKILAGYKINASTYRVLSQGVDFSFGPNNDGNTLILKSNNTIIDQVTYGNWDDGDKTDNASTPSQGKSITRNENHTDKDIDNLDFKLSDPTPGTNYTPKTYPYDIFINEILPAPNNGTDNEFIEIFNNGDTAVDLKDWQIDDLDNGGSQPYSIPAGTIIMPKGYIVLYHALTKIYLNNDGDGVRLIDPNQEEKSRIDYQKAEQGNSYAKFNLVWQWTEKITSGEENIYLKSIDGETDSAATQTINIAEARKIENGQFVKIEGSVTATPSVLSASYFYIEDETGGMQIYKHNKIFPTLQTGDRVSVYGKLSETAGEKRIIVYETADIKILASDMPPPVPITITQDQFGENYEGVYVKMRGKVTKSSGGTLYIESDGREIKVIVRKSANINKPKLHKGDLVEIAGIVSQYKNDYRLLPIVAGDVKITKSAVLPKAGTGTLFMLILAIFLNIILFQSWNIYQKARQKQ